MSENRGRQARGGIDALADLLITRHLQPPFVRIAATASPGPPIQRVRQSKPGENANQDIIPVVDIILITSLATKRGVQQRGGSTWRRTGTGKKEKRLGKEQTEKGGVFPLMVAASCNSRALTGQKSTLIARCVAVLLNSYGNAATAGPRLIKFAIVL